MRKKIFTKKRMASSSLRVAVDDLELVRAAALRRGISVSEFTRQALREKSRMELAIAADKRVAASLS